MTRRSTLLLLLSFFLHACGYLVRRFRSKPLNRFNFDRSGQTNEPRNIINIVKSILNENNKTESLLNIIAYGDKFLEKSSSDNVREQVSDFSRNLFLSSLNANGWNKVPGCLSDVRVKASIIAESNVVSVIGVADSRIARGLIAILCDGLTGYSPKDIANIDSNVLSVACGLQDILPPGRLNGFENMLKVIQEQISSFHSDTSLVISPDFSDIDSEYDIVDDSIMKVPVPSALKSFTASIDDKNSVSQQSIYYPDTVAVLLSGGVDSSVALSLLLQQGYKVKAFYLKIWLEDEIAHLNECPWEEDLQYAQSVCDLLNVTLETVSLQSEYWKEVVQYTLAEARLGRTPNPDVMCNSRIKFGMFYDYVGKYYYKVATGHYAQVRPKQQNTIEISESQSESEVELFCSPDLIKDQTYFLCNLRQDQLAKALFPIGHLAKSQVRVLAEQFNLPTKARKDSQGICFLGKLKFDDFIEFYLGKQPGEIRDYLTNEVIGEHNGLWFHTIGQRKGLGLLLFPGTIHMGPWFVASKDPTKNLLFVTNQLEVLDKARSEFCVEKLNWVSGQPPISLSRAEPIKLRIKLRHGTTFAEGMVTIARNEVAPNENDILLNVKLIQRDKGIAPGQFAAFYDGEVCLGAGVIADSSPSF